MSILSKELWDLTPVAQRVVNCQANGLSGKLGSKEWDELEYDEMLAVMGIKAPVYVVSAEVEAMILAKREEVEAGMKLVVDDVVGKILRGG